MEAGAMMLLLCYTLYLTCDTGERIMGLVLTELVLVAENDAALGAVVVWAASEDVVDGCFCTAAFVFTEDVLLEEMVVEDFRAGTEEELVDGTEDLLFVCMMELVPERIKRRFTLT